MNRLAVCVLLSTLSTAAAAANEWTTPLAPFHIHGSTYYVGSKGLSALLITSSKGHVLIDVPLADNVPMIEANIRALGFKVEDVRLILNSHAHSDHAGGIAALVRDSGAKVRASIASAKALRAGGDDADDPQHGTASTYAPVTKIKTIRDGAVLRLGPNALTAHITPGHTPGSTTWSWRSCAEKECVDLVYADSLTAISNAEYRYTDPAHPERLENFRRGLATIATLSCDILITPHPEASRFLDRVAQRKAGNSTALLERDACRGYAEGAGKRLETRIAEEAKQAHPDASY
jgi:metallo-beta-lactamase class B